MCDNYMVHLAPNDRSGTEIQGADQAAMQARNRQRDSRHGNGPMSAVTFDWEQHQRDYRQVEKIERRNNRGGARFRKQDILG